MSIAALNWARRTRAGDPGAKLVLIMLADYANHDAEAWPSFDTLAHDTELSRRTVIRKLAELEERGLITRVHRIQPGGQTSNVYKLTGVSPCHPAPLPGCQGGTRGGVRVTPEPPIEPHPLPPGWTPNRDDVALMQRRYPELDLDASTDRFISHFTETAKAHRDWPARWRSWITEDGSDPKRTKRTATRSSGTNGLGERNRRRADEAHALIAALQDKRARGD